MPVEFLTDDEAAAHGLYAGTPSQADLDRVFFLDDDDLAGAHRRASCALTATWSRDALIALAGVPESP